MPTCLHIVCLSSVWAQFLIGIMPIAQIVGKQIKASFEISDNQSYCYQNMMNNGH